MDINKVINEIDYDKNMHKKINNLWLSNYQIEVLNRNNIDYQNCQTMSQLLYYIDESLETNSDQELENIAIEISETNYYMNSKK